MDKCEILELDNFQALLENYESVVKEIDALQVEQSLIKKALDENAHLSSELNRVLSEKSNSQPTHNCIESELVENLKLQLQIVVEEKEHAIKLWQNATETVDYLEGELRIYHDNTEGLIPKSKLFQLKATYEQKINSLEVLLKQTKQKLEETITSKTKQLEYKDKEIVESLQCQDNTIKIIKNLEEEVLKLQQRLNEINKDKQRLEKNLKNQNGEMENFKMKNQECRRKVEEALQVVEAALNEKDAALLRENQAKEEILQLTKTLSDLVEGTDTKIKQIQNNYEIKLEKVVHDLRTIQEEIKIKNLETENYAKRCILLEQEIERLQKGVYLVDDSSTSKLLALEKNLENTFQKLLQSEKLNIQLKSEKENIKSDLDQMAVYYERDIKGREVEKSLLKEEIKTLKIQLDANCIKAAQSSETANDLNERILLLEKLLGEKNEDFKGTVQQLVSEKNQQEILHRLIGELQEQLDSQSEINKKWRSETKNITEQLEKQINKLKSTLNKIKLENKCLNDRLKEANVKLCEYRKYLEMISQDVNKITSITVPASDDFLDR